MPRFKVTCAACGHWESSPDEVRGGTCRSCGHNKTTAAPIVID